MKVLKVVLAALLFAAPVSADTTQSQLRQLFQQEQRALRSVPQLRLQALVTPRENSTEDAAHYSRAYIDSLPVVSGGPEWRCLSEALYFEARGETIRGQFAVAEVILNRVDSSRFPNTVCKVINQGTGRLFACQFTYTCDGKREIIAEERAYARVGKIARLMLDGTDRALTDDATYYHTTAVSPSWSRKFNRTATIGVHHFYRPHTRVSNN